MTRSIFGWSLPPGAAGDPNAPWNQEEGPCDVCGQLGDYCICPECPVCGGVGDPFCYTDPEHGLTRSFGQVALRAETDRLIQEEAEAELKEMSHDY